MDTSPTRTRRSSGNAATSDAVSMSVRGSSGSPCVSRWRIASATDRARISVIGVLSRGRWWGGRESGHAQREVRGRRAVGDRDDEVARLEHEAAGLVVGPEAEVVAAEREGDGGRVARFQGNALEPAEPAHGRREGREDVPDVHLDD